MRTTKILLFITLSLSAFSQCALVYNPFTNQFNCGGASGTVGGASNLTTVGAIPYVSAAGILNQDPTALFWDAANNRLGIGTNAPAALLDVAATTDFPRKMIGFGRTGAGDWGIILGNEAVSNMYVGCIGGGCSASGLDYFWRANWNTPGISGNTFQVANSADNSTTVLEIKRKRPGNTGDYLQLTSDSTQGNILSVKNTGNLLIGTTTDGNFKLDVAASGSSGTARFYNQGAGVADATRVVVRAGAGQSTTNLQEWQSSAGAVIARVLPGGGAEFFVGTSSFILSSTGGTQFVNATDSTTGLSLNSGWGVKWGSGAAGGTSDTGLIRSSAGVVEVNSGTAGTFRDLRVRDLITTLATPASSTAACTAGTWEADADYIYICTSTNNWKRVALTTF